MPDADRLARALAALDRLDALDPDRADGRAWADATAWRDGTAALARPLLDLARAVVEVEAADAQWAAVDPEDEFSDAFHAARTRAERGDVAQRAALDALIDALAGGGEGEG